MSISRKLSILFLLFTVAAVASLAQNVRFDSIAISVQSPSSANAIVVKNPIITVCDATLSTSVATCALHKVSTFTSASGSACPTNTQVVLTNTTSCVATGDALGNYGFWVPAGTVKFSVTGVNAQSQLFTLTANGGGTGGATIKVNGATSANQSILNLVAGTGINIADDGMGNISFSQIAATGNALLQPPSNQTFQGSAPTVQQIWQCPTGAAGSLIGFNFQKADGSNIFNMNCNGDVVFGDGINGHWTAAWFGNSTGTLASVGVFRLANTDIGLAWRNNAGNGDCSVSKDNLDIIHWGGCSDMMFGTSHVAKTQTPIVARPVISSSTTGDMVTSQIYVDASSLAYSAGALDDCDQIRLATVDAKVLGQTVDARGMTGALNTNNFTCGHQWTDDAYTGQVLLPPGIVWITSPAGAMNIPTRLDVAGIGVGRPTGGPSSGTIIAGCNEANANASHSVACGGATFNPTSGYCVNGTPSTVACPLMGWALYSDHFLPTKLLFDTHVHDLDINCNLITNCVALQNGMQPPSGSCTGKCGAQENSGPYNLRIDDFGNGNGVGYQAMLGSQNSDAFNLNIVNNRLVGGFPTMADCSLAHAIVVTATGTGNGPKRIADITSTNTGCTIDMADTVTADASTTMFDGVHCEQNSNSCLDVAKNQDVKGINTRDVNGVDNTGSVIQIETGHNVGGKFDTTLNINSNGYVIKDLLHGNSLRADQMNMVSVYGFDWSPLAGGDDVFTSSPFVAKDFVSGGFTSNSTLAAGDAVKVLVGSANTVIKTLAADQDHIIGFSRTAISNVAWQVPIVSFGVFTGPVTDTVCAPGDYIFPSPTTAGRVACSFIRPPNQEILGVSMGTYAAPPQAIQMFVFLQPPTQYVALCNGTGVTPLNCGTTVANETSYGTVACPHASSAGTCQINTPYVTAASAVFITRSTQLGTGANQCETALTETAATTNADVASVAAGNFIVNVPTLPTANRMYCFNWWVLRQQ